MKKLTINSTNGGKIVFGKLPIFTNSLVKELGDGVHNHLEKLVIVGRYYAAEMKAGEKDTVEIKAEEKDTASTIEESVLAKLAKNGGYIQTTKAFEPTPVFEPDRVAEECKFDVEQAKEEAKLAHLSVVKQPEKPAPSNDLTELGFTNLSSETPTSTRINIRGKKVGTDYHGKSIARGNLSLIEWLKPQDYLIYKIFSFGNGQPVFDQSYDFDECKRVFIDAGYPDKAMEKRQKGMNNASRATALALSQAVRIGALIRDTGADGKPIYSLSVANGRAYVAGIYRTISAATYDWAPRKGRVHHRG